MAVVADRSRQSVRRMLLAATSLVLLQASCAPPKEIGWPLQPGRELSYQACALHDIRRGVARSLDRSLITLRFPSQGQLEIWRDGKQLAQLPLSEGGRVVGWPRRTLPLDAALLTFYTLPPAKHHGSRWSRTLPTNEQLAQLRDRLTIQERFRGQVRETGSERNKVILELDADVRLVRNRAASSALTGTDAQHDAFRWQPYLSGRVSFDAERRALDGAEIYYLLPTATGFQLERMRIRLVDSAARQRARPESCCDSATSVPLRALLDGKAADLGVLLAEICAQHPGLPGCEGGVFRRAPRSILNERPSQLPGPFRIPELLGRAIRKFDLSYEIYDLWTPNAYTGGVSYLDSSSDTLQRRRRTPRVRRAAGTPAGEELLELLSLAGRGALAGSTLDRISKELQSLDQDEPMWPVRVFLGAEILKRAGRLQEAERSYRSLVEWGSVDPYADGRGGSALTTTALWRWLGIVEDRAVVDPATFQSLSNCYLRLCRTRRADEAVLQFEGHSKLPEMEAEAAVRLAKLAWRMNDPAAARDLFGRFLRQTRRLTLTPQEENLSQHLVDSGSLSREDLDLSMARRLMASGQIEKARELLAAVARNGGSSLRAEARLELARLTTALGTAGESGLAHIEGVLRDGRSPELIQQALWARAHSRADLLVESLEELVRRFPEAELADSALQELSAHHLNSWWHGDGNPEAPYLAAALDVYRRLRDSTARHQVDAAGVDTAVALYSQSLLEPSSAGLRQAWRLLAPIEARPVDGPAQRAARFWIGRIAEQSGCHRAARRLFRRLANRWPRDYYGIRAQMHLDEGREASSRAAPDQHAGLELRRSFRRSLADNCLACRSAYDERLAAAVDSGFYRHLLRRRHDLRRQLGDEALEGALLDRLEETGDLTALMLLAALRQDALAAGASALSAYDHLQVQAAVGLGAGDWSLVSTLAVGDGRGFEGSSLLQEGLPYLMRKGPEVGPESAQERWLDNILSASVDTASADERAQFLLNLLAGQVPLLSTTRWRDRGEPTDYELVVESRSSMGGTDLLRRVLTDLWILHSETDYLEKTRSVVAAAPLPD